MSSTCTTIPGGYITPNGNAVMMNGSSGYVTPNGNVVLTNGSSGYVAPNGNVVVTPVPVSVTTATAPASGRKKTLRSLFGPSK